MRNVLSVLTLFASFFGVLIADFASFFFFSRSFASAYFFTFRSVTFCNRETNHDEYLGHKMLSKCYLAFGLTRIYVVIVKQSVSIEVAEVINPMEFFCYEFRSTFKHAHTHNFLHHLFL